MDVPKHGIHPHNAVFSQREIKTASPQLILAAMSKMTNPTLSNTLTVLNTLSSVEATAGKNYVCNIELGIHKLEFTAYIYLTVYPGILQRSL